MLCGGAEGASHYIWAGFDAMRVLARGFNDTPEKASRPLSASAAGFVPGAGAGVLMLESLESARARGARIYAELLGAARQLRRPPRRRQHDGAEPGERAPLHPRRARGRRRRRARRSTSSTGISRRPPPIRVEVASWAAALERTPGDVSADHVDQVDDRPRARRGRRDRVGGDGADAAPAASCTRRSTARTCTRRSPPTRPRFRTPSSRGPICASRSRRASGSAT